MAQTLNEKPTLVRTVSYSRRFYFLDGKRISEKKAAVLIAKDAVRVEYKPSR